METREEFLYSLVEKHGWTSGAELGLWYGKIFVYLLGRCPELYLVGVDIWAHHKGEMDFYQDWNHKVHERRCRGNSERFGKRARILKMFTDDAAEKVDDGSLDFVFIDADHRTKAVTSDIQKWTPKLKKGGWMIGHDINWDSVRLAVEAEYGQGYKKGPDNVWYVEPKPRKSSKK